MEDGGARAWQASDKHWPRHGYAPDTLFASCLEDARELQAVGEATLHPLPARDLAESAKEWRSLKVVRVGGEAVVSLVYVKEKVGRDVPCSVHTFW